MLSFQKEPEPIESNIKTNSEKTEPAAQNTQPMDEDSQQYYTVSDKKKQAAHSTYLLVGLFVIGAVCLWFMIRKSSPSNAAAAGTTAQKNEQKQIEAAITRITGVRSQMFSGLEKIVKKFYEFSDFEQVNVNELSKNPFRIDNSLTGIKPTSDLSQLTIARSELELLSIMSAENGYCCMINDKILYEGDNYQGLTVTKITDNEVILSSGEMNIVLKLAENY